MNFIVNTDAPRSCDLKRVLIVHTIFNTINSSKWYSCDFSLGSDTQLNRYTVGKKYFFSRGEKSASTVFFYHDGFISRMSYEYISTAGLEFISPVCDEEVLIEAA